MASTAKVSEGIGKDAMMRAVACVLLATMLLIPVSNLRADEPVKPEQLKKAYDDALVQLKAAQDRKAELAKENESLAAKVDELKKQLATSQTELDAMKREVADNDERTFFLRSYHAAWQNFIRRYPEVMARWKLYLGNSVLTVPDSLPDVLNPEWPLPMAG
jgi:septal ring factor EnvC (AmiA/AmiB activator)